MIDNRLIALEDFLYTMVSSQHIDTKDIPQLDLYMDQVLTFLNSHLNAFGCEDKDLTKTMVNNYAKNKLIPAPEKKRYGKDHILLLIFIYYLKNVLSMSEIQSILTPVTELFSSQEDFVKFYEEILSMIRQSADQIMESLPNSIDLVKERFPVSEKEGSDTIQILAMICVFSYDVYIKKSMIEKLIHDNLKEKEKGTGTKEKK
ncbi:MAG: DUF1836 domain-containing protein [Blautia sp.]|nr:DUF1836 domain-containing protein [Blautia sp.]